MEDGLISRVFSIFLIARIEQNLLSLEKKSFFLLTRRQNKSANKFDCLVNKNEIVYLSSISDKNIEKGDHFLKEGRKISSIELAIKKEGSKIKH